MSRRSENSTKVFVGSLPNGVTTEDLRQLFAPYGEISECDIANRCGFLHLEDRDLANKAIQELNGTNFMGGRISVEKGRVKPRRNGGGSGGSGGGGPMRGGKDRGGPYARNEFRGPPQRNGGGYGGGRDFPPYGGGGGGDRFGGYERSAPRGYDGGYGDRRPPPFDDRRSSGGYGGDRRPPFNDDYGRRPYADSRPMYAEGPRGEFDDRGPPRGPGGYERSIPGGDLYSRRDSGPKPMGGPGGYADRGYNLSPSNGYSSYGGQGTPSGGGGGGGGYGPPPAAPSGGGYGSAPSSYSSAPEGGYNGARGGYGSQPPSYGNASSGGYGDAYGGAGGRGAYDAAYPPLPQQRGGYSSGGGPGSRGDAMSGDRY